MALTNEDIQAIAQLIQPLRADMQNMKDSMQNMKDDMQNMKDSMQNMKDDIQTINDNMQASSNRVTNIQLTLENQTNHNIQLLAENHLNLVDKLNSAIKVQDKSLLLEVQVSGLRYRIEALEKEFSELNPQMT